MAETHELRLKINAAAARAGAREFVSAIRSIQAAIDALDTRSDGAFTRIHDRARTAGSNFKALASQYNAARSANDRFTESVKRANAALSRQMALATQVRMPTATGGSGASAASTRAGDQQVSMQNRVKRAVDDTRLSVERLTTSLMKVGGFQSINEISAAFRRFQKEVGGAAVSAQQLDSAKTKLNSSLKAAQTSLVTLTAKAQENARAEKAAADAARQRASTTTDAAKAASQAAAAQRAQASEADRGARAQLAAAAAMRQAEQEASRLSNRLHAIGDTRGITAVNQALIALRGSLNGANASALQVRQAMSTFAEATNRAKLSVTQTEGAQARAARSARELANEERNAANNARQVESEMRSIAGAGNAMSKSLRDATGSMRGLENAFSGTFQIGSAFRTLIGSITFGTFIQSVYAAGAALQQFRVTMEVATGSVSGAMEQMDFIDGMTRELGTNLRTAREDFAKFAVAANLAGVETGVARDIFRSVSQAMTVMGRGTEDQRLAFLALEQMLSKNTISSEELRRQLGERLPGAVALMAKAVGVTTAELQDMLKAGELVSSEVLPKFAEEVDKAFGPGLERALTRAPAALGRFRNEIEFFLSSVADTGLMDELASGFDRLTQAMRSPEAREAAEKLGQGLADLAEIAFDFAEGFIEHIDQVGAVAKAVIGGLIVRQVILMGNALVTGSSRSLAAFSQLTASMTANTAAMAAHTKALTTATGATTTMTAAQGRQKAMTDVQLATMLRANGVFAATPGIMARGAAAMGAMGRAAGVAATGMATASRVMVGLAGPIGLAVTALSLLPLLFNDAGEAATDMASDVEAAVRRAGVSLDELATRDYTSASRQAFESITKDLDVLEASLTRAGDAQAHFADGLGTMLQVMGRDFNAPDLPGIIIAQQDRMLRAVSVNRDALIGLSDTAEHLVGKVVEIGQAAANNQGSWLSLYEVINRTITLDPTTAPALEGLRDMARANAEAELATAAHREQLTLLFGTEDDKAVTRFTQMALSALRAGEGLDVLQKKIEETKADAPALAARYTEVLDEIRAQFAKGVSIPQIRLDLGDNIGSSADELIRLREEFDRTARIAARFQTDFATGMDAFMNRFRIEGLDTSALEEAKMLMSDFAQFQDASLPIENLKIVLSEMTFPTEQAEAFSAAVERQFAALAPAEQTYDHLRQIIAQLAQDSQYAGVGMQEFAQKLADTARNTTDASRSAEDLRGALTGVLQEAGFTAEEIANMTQWLYDSADAATDAGRAATNAEGGMIAAANGADQIGDAAAAAAAQVRGLQAALNALGAVSADVPGAAAKIAADIRFQAEQKARPIYERAAAEFVREQEAAINEAYAGAEAAARNMGADQGLFLAVAQEDRDAALALVREGAAEIRAASLEQYNTEAWQDPNRRRGGGSRSDAAETADAAAKAAKAIEEMKKALDSSLTSLEAENNALMLLANGYTSSESAARLLGEAMAAGVGAIDEQTLAMVRQIEAAERLNDALSQVANDPVNDWMNSVPTWREAGQQIEVGVFNHLSDAISKFIQTGEFSFEELGQSILATVADIISDMAVKELVALFGGNVSGQGEGGFGLGGMLSNLFGNNSIGQPQGDPLAAGFQGGDQSMAMQNAMVSGGQQAAQAIQTAMIQAGQQVGQNITTSGQQAGAQMGTQVQTAGTAAGAQMGTQTMTGGTVAGSSMMTSTQTGGTVAASQMQQAIISGGNVAASQMAQASAGGGGGGGMLGGGLGGILLGAGLGLLGMLFNKSTPAAEEDTGPVTPVGIRQFAEGTPNTSGIPAILHDNEAVIPLSKGRKVPVDFGDSMGPRGGSKTVVQNFNISTPDADSFRKSQKQIAADAASSGQKALQDNG